MVVPARSKTILTELWSISLPEGWSVTRHPECVSLQPTPPVCALQISAHVKSGSDVTAEDLDEFRASLGPPQTQLNVVQHGEFTGCRVDLFDEGRFWKKWLLRWKNLMLFITYNSSSRRNPAIENTVDHILDTLRPVS